MNDDFNEKPKHRTRQSVLDFVVPLPVWECIDRLEQAEPNATMRFQIDYDYHDEVKKASLKQVPCIIVIVIANQPVTRIKGKIQQKDENSTRITGTAEFVYEMDKSIKTRLNITSLCFLLIVLSTVCLLFTQPSVFIPFIFFVALFIYLVLLLVLDSRNTAIKMQQLVEVIQRKLLFQ